MSPGESSAGGWDGIEGAVTVISDASIYLRFTRIFNCGDKLLNNQINVFPVVVISFGKRNN